MLAAALQGSPSARSAEVLEASAAAAILAAAKESACGHHSAAAVAVEAAPEDASLAVAAAHAFSGGVSAQNAGRKQQGSQHRGPRGWQRPGAKSGLPYFGCTSYRFTACEPTMKILRDKIGDREDLLKLLKGWLAYRDLISGNHYYRVPDEEGDIRSAINAVNYLKDLARLNAGMQPLVGEHPAAAVMCFRLDHIPHMKGHNQPAVQCSHV